MAAEPLHKKAKPNGITLELEQGLAPHNIVANFAIVHHGDALTRLTFGHRTEHGEVWESVVVDLQTAELAEQKAALLTYLATITDSKTPSRLVSLPPLASRPSCMILADIITLSRRGQVAETGFFCFSWKHFIAKGKGELTEKLRAFPAVTVRSGLDLQASLIGELYRR